jgi:hypothetical protein
VKYDVLTEVLCDDSQIVTCVSVQSAATILWVLVDKEVNVLGRYGSELVYVTFELLIYCTLHGGRKLLGKVSSILLIHMTSYVRSLQRLLTELLLPCNINYVYRLLRWR